MPNMLPADLENLLQDFLVTENTVYDPSMEFRVCVPNMLGGQTFCIPQCSEYNFMDFETTDDIPPCTTAILPTFIEQVILNITQLYEQPIENERELCFFNELDEKKRKCLSRNWRSVEYLNKLMLTSKYFQDVPS